MLCTILIEDEDAVAPVVIPCYSPSLFSSKLILRLFFPGLFPQIRMMDPELTVLKEYMPA